MAKSSGIGELIGWGIAGVGVWWVGSMFGWWTDIFGGSAPATTTATPTTSTTTTTPTTATTTTPTTTPTSPPPTVALAGGVTLTSNNALQANISIGGAVQNLACIPGGSCYNPSGQGVALPAGVTAAQIYALMQAAYVPAHVITTPNKTPAKTTTSISVVGPVTSTTNNALKANVSLNGTVQNLSCIPGGSCYNTSGKGVTLPAGITAAQVYAALSAAKGMSGYGMSAGIIPAGLPMRVPGARVMVHTKRKNYVMRGAGY